MFVCTHEVEGFPERVAASSVHNFNANWKHTSASSRTCTLPVRYDQFLGRCVLLFCHRKELVCCLRIPIALLLTTQELGFPVPSSFQEDFITAGLHCLTRPFVFVVPVLFGSFLTVLTKQSQSRCLFFSLSKPLHSGGWKVFVYYCCYCLCCACYFHVSVLCWFHKGF